MIIQFHYNVFTFVLICFPQVGTERSAERQCVRDALLAAIGVKSRNAITTRPQQILYSRIAHLGFLHDRLKEFIDPTSGLMPQGKRTLKPPFLLCRVVLWCVRTVSVPCHVDKDVGCIISSIELSIQNIVFFIIQLFVVLQKKINNNLYG